MPEDRQAGQDNRDVHPIVNQIAPSITKTAKRARPSPGERTARRPNPIGGETLTQLSGGLKITIKGICKGREQHGPLEPFTQRIAAALSWAATPERPTAYETSCWAWCRIAGGERQAELRMTHGGGGLGVVTCLHRMRLEHDEIGPPSGAHIGCPAARRQRRGSDLLARRLAFGCWTSGRGISRK